LKQSEERLPSDNHGSIKFLTKSVRSADVCCRARLADERVEFLLAMSAVSRVMRAHDRWTTFSLNRKQGRGGFSARIFKQRHIAVERAHLCREVKTR